MSDQQDLYGLPLEDFVPARSALAKALRKQGERARAEEIASLRKPSIAAWAVNQLIRTQKREVDGLFAAGDALQSAQSELLAGKGDAPTLRSAVAREREAVDALASKARGLLSADGHELSQTTLDRVSDTLHAAALDPDARTEVEQGALQRELRHVGLGEIGAITPAPARSRTRKAGAESQAKARASADAKRAKRESEQRAKEARAAEAAARRAAERAERELEAATARRDEAAEALKHAESEFSAATKAAKQATAEHRRTQRALERR